MIVDLPQPKTGNFPLEKALFLRRSVRKFKKGKISLGALSQLLWAVQGITNEEGFRTAPSAGALYPLEIYTVVGEVEELIPGVYRYDPFSHKIIKIKDGDLRYELINASLGQEWVGEGAVTIVITAIYDRTIRKYGSRGIRYTDMEAGHAAQNLLLQAVALGLGGVTVGAFYDVEIRRILDLNENEFPLYLIPIGKK